MEGGTFSLKGSRGRHSSSFFYLAIPDNCPPQVQNFRCRATIIIIINFVYVTNKHCLNQYSSCKAANFINGTTNSLGLEERDEEKYLQMTVK